MKYKREYSSFDGSHFISFILVYIVRSYVVFGCEALGIYLALTVGTILYWGSSEPMIIPYHGLYYKILFHSKRKMFNSIFLVAFA